MLRLHAAVLLLLNAIGCSAPEKSVPQEANASAHYLRAFELLELAGEDSKRIHDEAIVLVSHDKPYDPEMWSSSLLACAPALAEMEKATEIDHCRFAEDYDLDQALPWLARGRRLARVNSVWSWQLLKTGRGAEAVAAWRRGFGMARHLAGEGGVVGGNVGIAVAGIVMDTIRRALTEDLLDEATLRQVAKILADQPYGVISLATAMRGEKAAFIKVGEGWMRSEDPLVAFDEFMQKDRIPELGRHNPINDLPARVRQLLLWYVPLDLYWDEEATRRIFRKELEFFLGTFNDMERFGSLPYDQVRAEVHELDRLCTVDDPASRNHPITVMYTGGTLPSVRSRMKTESKRRGLQGMIEVRLFMHAHGRAPAADDDLWLPADTCSGLPMRLEVTGEEVILHCDIEENDPDHMRRAPFYAGVYRLPIPASLRR